MAAHEAMSDLFLLGCEQLGSLCAGASHGQSWRKAVRCACLLGSTGPMGSRPCHSHSPLAISRGVALNVGVPEPPLMKTHSNSLRLNHQ